MNGFVQGVWSNAPGAGRLDRRVSLLSPIESRDAGGGVVKWWLYRGTTWATVNDVLGRETQEGEQKLGIAAANFRIRYRTGLDATWRAVFDGTRFEFIAPPVEVGRRQFLDLACQGLAPANSTADDVGLLAVTTEIEQGDESKAITYGLSFTDAPDYIYVTLLVPASGDVFEVGSSLESVSGLTAAFGASVPASGYKLSVISSRFDLGSAALDTPTLKVLSVSLSASDTSKAVTFVTAFGSVPRGLSVELVAPGGGAEFLVAVSIPTIAATGFTAVFGAAVPASGYSLIIRAVL
jgi:SPP1 family predicted phage head-tail adaptor